MNKESVTILLSFLLLSNFAVDVMACGPPDCGDCAYWDGESCVSNCHDVNCPTCKSCNCEGNCYYPEGNECTPDPDSCGGTGQTCQGCKCKCYAPPGSESVERSTGLSNLASGIESAIDGIPRVTASGFGASVSFSASKTKQCCDPDDSGPVDRYCMSGSVDLEGTVGVDIPALGWSWEKEWSGVGSIECSLGIEVTPTITVESSASAGGCESACGACLTLSGSANASGSLLVEAGGTIALQSQTGWTWLDNLQFEASATASAEVSMSAWGSGTWKTGSECCFTGLRINSYGVSNVEATGTLEFVVLGFEYNATSDPITLIEGLSETPTYDPPC